MKKSYSAVVAGLGLACLSLSSFAEMPTPIAQWSFEDDNDLGAPSVGTAELTRFTTGEGRSAQESGRIGQSLAVYGGNGTNKVPDAWWTTTGVMPTGSSPFTVSAWFKPCAGTGSGAYLFVYRTIGGGVPNGYTGANWTGWYLRFCNSGNSLAFDFTSGWRSAVDDNQCMIVSKPSGLTYADGKWHHFAITRTADFTVSIYVDGICLGSKKLSVNQTVPNARFGIGGQDGSNNFRGNFDEVKVYDQALTAGQIVKEFYSYDPNTVVDEDGRIILNVAEGVVATNAVSYDVGLSLAKTGAGKLIMHHGSGNFPGSVGVSNGWFRTGEQNSFRHATGFAVEEGATLEFGRSADYAAPITGAGTLRLSGAGAFNLTGDLSGFAGQWSTYVANVDFSNVPSATSSLDVGNGGFATFHDDVSLAALSGQGLLGGVALPDGKTLTVSGANNAEFAGRLVGAGKLVKNGAGTLTLSGDSEFAEVDVRSGSVALKRAVPSDQHAVWHFEDVADIGAEALGVNAGLVEMNGSSGVSYVKQVDGLVGKGVEVKTVSGSDNSFLISAPDADLPRGTSPYTFSAWIRPYSTTVGNAYIARFQNLTLNDDGTYNDTGWGSSGWYLVSHSSGTKLSLSYPYNWSGDGGAASQKVTGDLPSGEYHDDKWHHVAFTLDETKALRLYWDGKKIGENLKPDRCSVSATARLQLGSYERSTGHMFNGVFDEVQYVDGAWSDERIAAEYASRAPLATNATLPTPLAHWTFDQYETDGDGKRYFADKGRSGWHLFECKNGENTVDCIDATSPQGEGVNGGAAYVPNKNTGAFLRVDSSVGIVPKDTYSTKNPDFTTSVRFRCAGNNATPRQIIFSFGSAQSASTCMRLVKESEPTWSGNAEWVPRILRLLPGGANSNEGSVIEDTYASYGDTTPWTTITCVNQASTKTVIVYRDGREIARYPSSYSLELDRIYVFAGYWNPKSATPETCTGFAVDDIRVYDRLLSPAQVKAVVYEQANVQPNGLAQTAVKLAAGTTLEAKDGSLSAAAVSGAGEVKISAEATFGAADWTGFTGSVTGAGRLALSSKLPAGVTVAETVEPCIAGAVTDAAGTGLPLVETAGAVRIAATGVVRVTDVSKGADLAGKSFVLARAGSFLAPLDFSGWTVEPADAQVPYEFFVRGNEFRLKVKGGGTVLLVR